MSWRRKKPGHQQPWYWPSESDLLVSLWNSDPHVDVFDKGKYCKSMINTNCVIRILILAFWVWHFENGLIVASIKDTKPVLIQNRFCNLPHQKPALCLLQNRLCAVPKPAVTIARFGKIKFCSFDRRCKTRLDTKRFATCRTKTGFVPAPKPVLCRP